MSCRCSVFKKQTLLSHEGPACPSRDKQVAYLCFFFSPKKKHSTVDVSVRIEHDLIVTATALVVLGKVGGSIDQRWKMERSFLLKWRVCDLWKDKIETIKGMFCPFCGNHVMMFIKLCMEKNLKMNSLHFELLCPVCGY